MVYSGFPVDASIISSQALATNVLSKYHLQSPLTCKFLQRGLNDTYTVQTGSSTYYLRVYRHGLRKKSEIDAEVDMLIYLVRERQPVAAPVAMQDGTYLTRIDAPEGTRYAVLFTDSSWALAVAASKAAASTGGTRHAHDAFGFGAPQ